MKILHTSDWHLGHRLLEQPQHEEQQRFLDWLTQYIARNCIDVLLVCGDVFDTGAPASQSLRMYYNFLIGLKKTSCEKVIVIGGNHDAPGTLDAPKDLLQFLSVYVVGKATDPIEDEIITIEKNDEKLTVFAVPFLRDSDIRKAIAGETIDEISGRYKKALINHYSSLAQIYTQHHYSGLCIAMGHLFAIGGATAESEQSIYVGNLGDIGADDFPSMIDYTALGHLHRAQVVGKKENIRYCGAPYALSFSEINSDKQIIVLKTEHNKIQSITNVNVPQFRKLERITGTLDQCIAKLSLIDKEKHELTPWVEVVLEKDDKSAIGFTYIEDASKNMNLQVLKVTFKREQNITGIESLVEESFNIKELSPVEVFKMKCKEQNVDLANHPEIWDAYNEALQKALEDK